MNRATGPVFDPGGASSALLRFQRWIGVEKSPNDGAWIELWDGESWHTVWENPVTALADRSWALETIELGAMLAGTNEARLRVRLVADNYFVYAGWNLDEIEVIVPGACEGVRGPAPIPDGKRVPGETMRATKESGGTIRLSWDATRCPVGDTHLSWGREEDLSLYDYEGSLCALGSSGIASVTLPLPPPGSLVWWTLAGAEGDTESLHGYASSGEARDAQGVGRCGVVRQDASGVCE